MYRVILAGLLVAVASYAEAQWLDWDNVTATHLVSSPALGSLDVAEKDYAVGDFDQDGDPDVIAVRKLPYTTDGPMSNVLFLNVGGTLVDSTAQLAPEFLVPNNARDVVAVDIDGDTWVDVVIATADNAGVGEQPRVFINQGDDALGDWLGFLEAPGRLPTITVLLQGPKSCAIDAGDVNGDTFPDLYLGDYNSPVEDRLLLNDGFGFFSDQTASLPATFVNSAFNTTVRIADLNGDGAPEILKNTSGGVRVVYNQGGGVFAGISQLPANSAYSFDVGDLNGDGRNDVYVGQDGQDRLLLNDSPPGSGVVTWQSVLLTQAESPLTAGFVGNIYIVDLDDDGANDVAVCDQDVDVPQANCNRRLAFLRNTHMAAPVVIDPHQPTPTIAQHCGTYDTAIADFDGDGLLDVLVGHSLGTDLYFQVLSAFDFRRSDVNSDGAVDVADPVFLLDHLFGAGNTPLCLDAGDANDDGSLNVADAVSMLAHLFAGGAAPPNPSPGCGPDPTVDLIGCLGQPGC